MGRGLLHVDVLAGLQRPDGRQRVPVVRCGDHHGVDFLVIEDAAHVLHEVGLEARHFLQTRIVDPRVREVGVDVAQRLDVDVVQVREPALERVPLSAYPDDRHLHTIVGAEDASVRLCSESGAEEPAAYGNACRRCPDARGEIAPCNAVLVVPVAGHGDLLLSRP